MAQYLRAYREQTGTNDEPGSPMRFTASTENIARDGLVIEADGWDLVNYKRNPVILWAHDLMGSRPPIGRAVEVFVEKKKLIADIQFDQDDEFARMIEKKYRKGFLHAVSVGWDTKEFAPPKGGGAPRITKAELLEISGVPVGSDPSALKTQQARALHALADELEALAGDDTRATSRPFPSEHACRLRDPSDFKDGSFRRTSRDSGGKTYDVIMGKLKGENTMTEQSYRYPKDEWTVGEARAHCRDHDGIEFAPAKEHGTTADRSTAWEDAAAAMVRLYLPDVRMTERERHREYIHLVKVYRTLDKTPPEWMGLEDVSLLDLAEIRGLFGEGEPEVCSELLYPSPFSRVSKVLSKRNQDDIVQAVSLLNGVLKRAEKEAEQSAEAEPERGLDDALAELIMLAPIASLP